VFKVKQFNGGVTHVAPPTWGIYGDVQAVHPEFEHVVHPAMVPQAEHVPPAFR